jgi:hypothetical protein
MPKPSPTKIPLKFFGEARKTARAQLAAARASAPAAAAAEGGSARVTLASFLRIHLEFLAAHPDSAAVLYDDAAPPAGARSLQEHRKLMLFLLAEFEKIVTAGKTAKTVRGDVDPAMAAIHCLGAIQMAWTFWTIAGRRGDLVDAGLKLFEQLWAGIKV